MAGIRVVTDSSSDLPQELADRHGIDIVPLSVRFGDEELVDRVQLSAEEFWARCARAPALPQTAAPAPGAFETAFARAREGGADGVVCVTISADLSATAQAAQSAARAVAAELPVEVVDSRSVTMGLGLIALEAARRAAEGRSLAEVVAAATEATGRTRVYGTLDTLENLRKGGRIGGAAALLGSVLSVKPVIEVRDGKVEAESRQRTRARALRYLADKVAAQGRLDHLAVMHAAAPDVEGFVEMVAAHHPREDLIVAEIGPVIGTHAGPRTVAVAFQVPA